MNATLSRILVAVDGSENSERAFETAMWLAKRVGSSISAIYVIETPSGDSEYVIVQLMQFLERRGVEILEKHADIAKSKYGIELERILLKGYPAKVILDAAKKQDVHLIVMGSRGMSGIKELFLGSVSHSVVRGSKVPVLVVK